MSVRNGRDLDLIHPIKFPIPQEIHFAFPASAE